MINLTDYNDFFLFLGGLLTIGGIIYLLFRRSLQNVFIEEQEAERLTSEEEISKFKDPDQTSTHKILLPGTFRNVNLRLSLLSKILLAIIIGGFLFNQVLMWRMNSSNFLGEQVLSFGKKPLNINITITKK